MIRKWSHMAITLFSILLFTACGQDSDPAPSGQQENPTQQQAQPPQPPPPAANPLTAGRQHTCAVKPTGELYCWGLNLDSELGDGTSQNRHTPVPVKNLKGVRQAAAGGNHTCAVLNDGFVWCWGRNHKGQLGVIGSDVSNEPVKALGVVQAVEVSAGQDFSCALNKGKTVYCWGNGDNGRLGSGNTKSSPAPVAVAGLKGVKHIASGRSHSCAVTEAGEVWCWGSNSAKQSALPGDMRESPRPMKIAGLSGVTQIAAGNNTTCAIDAQGNLFCWGYNYYGNVGNGKSGSGSNVATPLQVAGITNVKQVGLGEYQTCAIQNTGQAFCWGRDGYGNLGGAERGDQTAPSQVANVTDASALAVGGQHVCALRNSGAIACWGRRESGQLGAEEISDPYHATDVVPALAALTAQPPVPAVFPANPAAPAQANPMISTSEGFACALRANGHPVCWGGNGRGQLGDGTTISRRSQPAEVSGITDAVEVRAGAARACARRANGMVACWGSLGHYNGSKRVVSSRPLPLQGITDAQELAIGGYHHHSTCIRHATGTVSCVQNGTLTPIAGLADVAQITAGFGTVCARLNNGQVWCWGRGDRGLLGNGQDRRSATPVQVSGLNDAILISNGNSHVCALRQNNRVMCWGSNEDGQLGTGEFGDDQSSNRPVEARGIRDAIFVSAGMNHTCAVRQGGQVMCWGGNTFNQTAHPVPEGQERPEHVPRPTAVAQSAAPNFATLGPPVAVDCGWHVSCLIHQTHAVSCWGTSSVLGEGLLGGLFSGRSPTPVPLPNVRLTP